MMGVSTITAGKFWGIVEGDPEEVVALLAASPYVQITYSDQVVIVNRDQVDYVASYNGDAAAHPIERFVPRSLVGTADAR